jgi:hypothetical protein
VQQDPFTPSALANLVHTKDDSGRISVVTHEGVQKEFKESFTWGSIGLYAKTMAAFANARGGYLIFGVTDKPRIAIGLTDSGRQSFDELDRAKLTAGLNELFSPEINWDSTLMPLGDATLGLIYTYESENKPVMARKAYQQQNAHIAESDIFYRYNSRTERAKFPELKHIIDDARTREQKAMMTHIEELVRAGASNAAVLDFTASTLQGPTGERILVDEELLGKIAFIREGEFSEVHGAPTLRLVGDVTPANTIRLGSGPVVHRALTTEDVITDFLDQTHGTDPEQYIRQAASGVTSFVPVHFYATAAGMTHDQLIDFVAATNTRAQAKSKLIDRLSTSDSMQISAPPTSSQHPSTLAKRKYYESLLAGQLPTLPFADTDEVIRFLQAVQALDDEAVEAVYHPLLEHLKVCMEEYYASSSRVADMLRRATCRVDTAMYGPQRASIET